MKLKEISRFEIMALAGGAIMAIGLFLPWYEATSSRAEIGSQKTPGTYSAWDIHTIQRWLWLAAALAPFILTYIIIRGHALSWPRGEMTAVVGIAAFGMMFYAGLIDRPGEPGGLIEIKWGYFVALLGVIVMIAGSALRASETERPRKPPGVL